MINKNKIINSELFLTAFLLLIISVAGCDKEVSRSPVEADAPQGFIYVNSEPSAFTIFLNGRNTGRLTPDSISYIDQGTYEITLRKKYYKDTSLIVVLNESEKLNVSVDILSNPSMYGNLYLKSIPEGAAITINDSALNIIAPFYFKNLLPGEYNIKFDLFNHRSLEFIGIVQSSDSTGYIRALRDTSVWVDYQVTNSDISSNLLYTIVIDNNNIKWIGSVDKGLIKYNEENFINYNTSNSQIPGNRVNCIAIDDQNRVWVGTNDGIGIFDGSSWIVYNRNNSGLTNEHINKIRFYGNNTVWIATVGNLIKFDGINWSTYEQPEGKDWINDFYIENENKLYLGTKLDGIFLLENQNFSWVRWWDYVYCTMTVTTIEKTQNNEVWFGFAPDTIGRSGISVWDGNSFTNIHFASLQNIVNHIYVDDQNDKWIGTSDGLLNYNNQNISKFYNSSNSLISSNNVSASAVDFYGNVWITTIGGGLNKYKPPQ